MMSKYIARYGQKRIEFKALNDSEAKQLAIIKLRPANPLLITVGRSSANGYMRPLGNQTDQYE